MLIIDPPKVEIGDVYEGTVVSVTNFGAFINILPGRDGLMHISKVGRGKRVERVEDVLNIGDTLQVLVDDVDPVKGKVSLVYGDAGSGDDGESGEASGAREERAPREERPRRDREDRGPRSRDDRGSRDGGSSSVDESIELVDFDAHWEEAAKESFGDLGPADERPPARNDGPRRDGRGGGRGGRRGGRR
jgi:polyribonucleotide nucleotidyltransferase